ncbi:MAG: hypothetical protein OXI96_05965, partial [Acidimicrobiaceae bacterium]|nr:hypothetical protein [Acidimicrobiaceae bacterium]
MTIATASLFVNVEINTETAATIKATYRVQTSTPTTPTNNCLTFQEDKTTLIRLFAYEGGVGSQVGSDQD